jgi:hypothetical protein
MSGQFTPWFGTAPFPATETHAVVQAHLRNGSEVTAPASELTWLHDGKGTNGQEVLSYRVLKEHAYAAYVLEPVPVDALKTQVGGDHYKDLPIQPVEYIHANEIGYFEGNVIKYVSRWRKKNGIADLEKARHYIDLLIELESKHAN